MAVADPLSTSLRLVFVDGVDEMSGDVIYKSKNFNRIKTTASAEELYKVAQAFVGLQERTLFAVERRDQSEIREA